MVLGSKKLGKLITKRGANKRKDEWDAESNTTNSSKRKRLAPRSRKKSVEDVEIGDKINLQHCPWKKCKETSYPCKVVRRPAFAERELIKFAGGAGARAVARSTMQHVMIIDRHVVEYTRLNGSHGRVAFVTSVDGIYKMRLRQEEQMIALFFKSGKDDPLILNCPESAMLSQQIRASRGRGLVKKESVNKALHLIQAIQAHESALDHQPSVERVNEIASLYDQAAEQFAIAGEQSKHDEVKVHKLKFMELPKVENILKGNLNELARAEPKREPEILENSVANFDDLINGLESDDDTQNWADFEKMNSQEVEKTSQDESLSMESDSNMHNWADFRGMESREEESPTRIESANKTGHDMLLDVRQGFDAFNLGNTIDSEVDRDGEMPTGIVKDVPAFKEFDAMLDAADRELEEILKI